MITTKRSHLTAIIVMSILGGPAPAWADSIRLDLEQATKMALEHNHGVAAMRHEIDAARAAERRSGTAFRPTLGIAGGAENKVNEEQSESAGFGYAFGSINLFNGFRDQRRRDLADAETSQASERLAASEIALSCAVEEQFGAYLFKKALIALKRQAVARNEVHQRLARKSRSSGSISETDVMEFQLRDATLRSELALLGQDLEDARDGLKQLLGAGGADDFEPVGELTHVHVSGSISSYLEKAKTSGLPVKSASSELDKTRLELKVSEARWLPTIGVEARTGYLPLSDRKIANKPEGNVVLTASLELYGGGGTYWETREKAAAVLASEAKLREEMSLTTRKVEKGFRNLKTIEARADIERNNVAFARKYYESILSEYKRGFKNSSDLSSAAQTLSEAEERKIVFDFDFLKQRLDLERLLGSPVTVEVAP